MVTPVVVVTGAASGIGRACVELFAERGFKVVAVDLAENGLAELAAITGVVTLTGDIAAETTNTAMVRLAVD
ncbi:SDR family NAD(P)-dependent oxidoreductase, partial [Frankia sp. CiP3]|uniref:SDR family NAD(P)-dependent oxidoreductase n=1 Tax=Frankia sp. CiP3 TaxID=2880971 RepID=UPI001EF43D96